MDKFLDLLRESIIVQGLVTLCLIVTICILFATGKPVPDLLAQITLLVVGFWFGTKVQYYISGGAKK
jgi:hypothetical protein